MVLASVLHVMIKINWLGMDMTGAADEEVEVVAGEQVFDDGVIQGESIRIRSQSEC